MKITLKILIAFLIPLLVFTTLTCALSVNSVSVDKVSPGEDGIIKVNVENDGNRDIDFLSFNIEFPEDKIIPIGCSSASLNELKEDDDETFAFRFNVAKNLAAGTYSLSYLINYEENNAKREQKGTIGIVVSAEPELEVTADIESPIIGQQGTLNIRVVNKGLADARFVSLSIESDDITFLGERSEYIGTIDSDDFESVSFDIIPTTRRPDLSVRIEYKDFENNDKTEEFSPSLIAYTEEQALSLGLISKNNTLIYVVIAIVILLVWYFWRRAKKRKKLKEAR